MDRRGGGLSCNHLSARILDDAAAAKFRMVRAKRFFFRTRIGRASSFSGLCAGSRRILCKVDISIYFHGFLNIGKDIVVATTAICWYIGIVVFNSDYAFTVTNVIIHGVPYFALIYFYARSVAIDRPHLSNAFAKLANISSDTCGRWHMSKNYSGTAEFGTKGMAVRR